ncbi:MAG: hypothetical protein ACTIOG_07355 [Pseudomonas helleri]|uniref:hypothetical protein n=1 Tax=Pseudomonas helleri TaxID=1608996 RepID=UPI003FD4E8B4
MNKQSATQTLAADLSGLAKAAGSVDWKWWDSNSTLRLTTEVEGRHGADGDAISAYRDSVQCPEPFRAFIKAASPAAILALATENEFLTESRNEAREDRNKIGDRYDQIKIENNELRKTAERAEYWKQRAKSAEGHLFSSDWRAAALELHKYSAYEATPWSELTGSQQAALYSAAGSVIAAVNNRRGDRAPKDGARPDEVSRLDRLAGFWRSPENKPESETLVVVLRDAGNIGNQLHAGHRSGRWIELTTVFKSGFVSELFSTGRVIGWVDAKEFVGSEDATLFRWMARQCGEEFRVDLEGVNEICETVQWALGYEKETDLRQAVRAAMTEDETKEARHADEA